WQSVRSSTLAVLEDRTGQQDTRCRSAPPFHGYQHRDDVPGIGRQRCSYFEAHALVVRYFGTVMTEQVPWMFVDQAHEAFVAEGAIEDALAMLEGVLHTLSADRALVLIGPAAKRRDDLVSGARELPDEPV